MSECDALGNLRKDIFGREDLVGPGEIPDFSNLELYQIISFFKEAKFETLTMHPFLAQYLPTDMAGNKDNEDMRAEKEAGFKEGQKWMSKYLFHIPTKQAQKAAELITDHENQAEPSQRTLLDQSSIHNQTVGDAPE